YLPSLHDALPISRCARASARYPSLRASPRPRLDPNIFDLPGPSCAPRRLLPPQSRAKTLTTAPVLSLTLAPSCVSYAAETVRLQMTVSYPRLKKSAAIVAESISRWKLILESPV